MLPLPFCLLFISLFHICGALCRESGGDIDVDMPSPDTASLSAGPGFRLSPAPSAAFGLTITFALITLCQLADSLQRFRSTKLPEGEPALRYAVGVIFRILLTSYTAIYLLNNILYALCIIHFGGNFLLPDTFGGNTPLPHTLQIGTVFAGQFAIVLFYATLLSIIAYRQRIQLNSEKTGLNLKTCLDGCLLATILILAIAQATVLGGMNALQSRIALPNFTIAYHVFVFLASLDVAISSFVARARVSRVGAEDKIINMSLFVIAPIVVTGGVFRIIYTGIECNGGRFVNFDGLFIAGVVTEGIVSIATVSHCLLMGVPTTSDTAENNC